MTPDGAGIDKVAELIDAHVRGEATDLGSLSEAEAQEASEALRVVDLLWDAAHGAPPLNEDPLAAALGLVPDPSRALGANQLRQALSASGVTVTSLASRLSARGWDVAPRDVFAWQAGNTSSVPPALIQAISEELRSEPDKLTADATESQKHSSVSSITSSPAFIDLARRWARLRGTSLSLAASALESRLTAAVFRGTTPDEDQMLASLEALVTAVESRESTNRSAP